MVPAENGAAQPSRTPHHERLESEAIHILPEAVAETLDPVMLFSAGKDSTVMAHLALRAYYPGKPPFPLLHNDSIWESGSLLVFLDGFARDHGFDLIARANEEGRAVGFNLFDHGERYTSATCTEPLKAALDQGGYDANSGGALRDDEKSCAKERVLSIRSAGHGWDPRQQRAELWHLYNSRLAAGQSAGVFPMLNWREVDIWSFALLPRIPLVPLYFAQVRPVVERNGASLVVDDPARMRFKVGETMSERSVRFRTLGCRPLTAAVESQSTDLSSIVRETLSAADSERQGRIGDSEYGGSLEQKNREGYF